MHATFLLGPAGSGKTFRCLQEVRAALAKPQPGTMLFLSPRQATFQLERELLRDPALAGYTGLQILSFERLAELLLDQFARPAPRVLTEEGRVMVLRALLSRLSPRLAVFRASARLPGFASQLSSLIGEFQQHGITAARLTEVAESPGTSPEWSDKVRDFSLLLDEYLGWLREHQLQDPSTLLDAAAEVVRQAIASSQFRVSGLWLDGFAQLAPQEIEFLAALIPGCGFARLAFCVAPEAQEDWHCMWATVSRSYRRCRERFQQIPGCSISVEWLKRSTQTSRFAESKPLAWLERHWDANPPAAAGANTPPAFQPDLLESSVRLYQCDNPEAEAGAAAREILRHVQEEGGRFRDVAVLLRGLEGYSATIGRVFRRYQIPFFIDRREPVSHHPIAELTRYALRLVLYGWQQPDWLGALKTGLVIPEMRAVDLLENEALSRGLDGRDWLRQVRASKLPAGVGRDQVLQVFTELATAIDPSTPRTGPEMAAAISHFWEGLRVERTLESWIRSAHGAEDADALLLPAVHQAAWEMMQRWLEEMSLAFQGVALSLREWLPIVEAGLANMTVGVVPPALDQVLIGAIDRSRNPNLEIVILVGMNESVFPATPKDPMLFSEWDRDCLAARGLSLGLNRRDQIGFERFLGYIGCTRARRRVVVTYALRDDLDAAIGCSPFVAQLRQWLPGLELRAWPPPRQNPDLRHWSELLAPVLRRHRLAPPAGPDPWAEIEKLPVFAPLLGHWDQWLSAQGCTGLTQQTTNRLYGSAIKLSISSLEDYAACPFRLFVARGLKAGERDEFQPDARVQGEFLHDLMKAFQEAVVGQGRRWRDYSAEEAGELARKLGEKLQRTFRDGIFDRTAQGRFQGSLLTGRAQRALEIFVSWARQYGFEPKAAELEFGRDDSALGPWRVKLEGGRELLLRGRIDRIDLAPGNPAPAVILDYKSSLPGFKRARAGLGLDLQLLAYLGMLRRASEAKSAGVKSALGVPRVVPAGAFYVPLSRGESPASSRAEAFEAMAAAGHEAFQHRGWFRFDLLAQFDNREAQQGDQFKYKLLNAGGLAARGNEAMPPDQFEQLLDAVEMFLKQYGDEIFAGVAAPNPCREGSEVACDKCQLQTICRFDRWLGCFRKPGPPAQSARPADRHE